MGHPMAPEQKSKKLLIRFAPTELQMLIQLSERTGLTKADVVRQLIRREHSDTIGVAPKPKRKPKK
jgi:predicted DNA-binding protein